MNSQAFSFHHLIRMPEAVSGGEPGAQYPTIITFHGRGSNEEDLLGLADHLPEELLWVSPRAPLALGPNAYEWFRVRVVGRPEPEQVLAVLESIDRFLDELLGVYPIDPGRIFLMGFSQGSLLSMCYAMSHAGRIAGVIAQSGYIPEGVGLEINEAALKRKPFLLTHGEQDTMIPIEWSRRSRDILSGLGVDLSYHEFPMGHTVSLESLSVVSAWLEERLVPNLPD